jgi:hypothetical protein
VFFRAILLRWHIKAYIRILVIARNIANPNRAPPSKLMIEDGV